MLEYTCETCSKVFRDKTKLTEHIRTHTGEKPFVCEFEGCDYKSATKGQLNNHTRRIHTEDKPFKCEVEGCEYSTKSKSDLTRHNLTHTGVKAFKCSKCDYRCALKPNLSKHEKIHDKPVSDIVKNICEICGEKKVKYNIPGITYGIRCKEHKTEEMVNIKGTFCKLCKVKRRSFNFPTEKVALYCEECAKKYPGMINVNAIKCISCNKQATYGLKDGPKIYCRDHKPEEAVDLHHKMCCVCKDKIPVFNYSGLKPEYCAKDKLEGMVDLVSDRCIKCNERHSSFNYETEIKPEYCSFCRTSDMINIRRKKCYCGVAASYGYINQFAVACIKHKSNLMFRKRYELCEKEDCSQLAEYGSDLPLRCYLHSLSTDICLTGQTCSNCKRENELCDRSALCFYMCSLVKLNEAQKKFTKRKEREVLDYLDAKFPSLKPYLDDKIIDTACVKVRPDRVYDLGDCFLVIEIDEFAHKGYYSSCVYGKDKQELRRMVQIHEALSMAQIPCIFLRYNPDAFKVNGKSQRLSSKKRLETLAKWVDICQTSDKSKLNEINIKYLFYDNYDETDTEFQTINELSELI